MKDMSWKEKLRKKSKSWPRYDLTPTAEESDTWKFKYNSFWEEFEQLKKERKAWEDLVLCSLLYYSYFQMMSPDDKAAPAPTLLTTPEAIKEAQQDLAKRSLRVSDDEKK